MPELLRNILDAVSNTFRHLSAVDFETLLVVAIAVAVVGIILLRR